MKHSILKVSIYFQGELPGFYDPCIGKEKELSIMYEFRRKMHYCRVSDKTTLHIPARGTFSIVIIHQNVYPKYTYIHINPLRLLYLDLFVAWMCNMNAFSSAMVNSIILVLSAFFMSNFLHWSGKFSIVLKENSMNDRYFVSTTECILFRYIDIWSLLECLYQFVTERYM